MRINSSTVAMTSSRSYKAEAETTQVNIDRHYGNGLQRVSVQAASVKSSALEVENSAAVFVNAEADDLPSLQAKTPALAAGQSEPDAASAGASDANAASTNAASAAQKNAAQQMPSAPSQTDWLSHIAEEIEKDPTIQLLRRALNLLDRLRGKKSSHSSLMPEKTTGAFQLSSSAASVRYQSAMAMFGGEMQMTPVQRQEGVNGFWTRQTVQSGFVKGEEHTAFSSVGTVVTDDGRTIDFGVSLEMSREFEAAFELAGQEAVYTDPLVINLDTQAASLSDVSFYFDLNGDGTKEELSGLGEGSGFLALDKNGDGEINDGSELFGAKTGNGFAELAQYDQDGNGWIDEGDDVFSKLSVWVKCGSGESRLISLKDAGVGAIFLGSQKTQFALSDSSGNVNAMVRRTGVYLKENGETGTVQHVDFKG